LLEPCVAEVLVALGSNRDPAVNLVEGVRQLAALGRVQSVSHVYESPAGPGGEGRYLNAAIRLETALTPRELKGALQSIEHACGRHASAAHDVPLDLDLILFGDQPPTDGIDEHAYLAVPLSEVAPSRRHPVTGETLRDFANRLQQQGQCEDLLRREDVSLNAGPGAGPGAGQGEEC